MSSGRDAAIQRLRHIREAADRIASYCARGRDAFEEDAAVRDAILYQIIVIGEAAKAVVQSDPALAATMSNVEWSPLARMRDRLTHQYWATDLEMIWVTATRDVPEVRRAVDDAIERRSDSSR